MPSSPSLAEPQVRFFSAMPKDYQFVPKGDVYVTSNVRKRTHAAGARLYVVIDKHKKPIGLRCPTSIYKEVTAAAKETAASRAAVVQNRDAVVECEFEAELLRLFPKVPRTDVAKILKQALEKRSGRVGRTGALDLDLKVQLAVKAHIRHCRTPYEQLLDSGTGREKARQMVMHKVKEVARTWVGDVKQTRMDTQGQETKRKRKTKIGQAGPRKRTATKRASRSSVRPASGVTESSGDVEDESSAEESDSYSLSDIFDDDPEDSDWLP